MHVTFRVPAKINIVLSIGPLRPDGFHDLATVFHAVSLYDNVTARWGDEEPRNDDDPRSEDEAGGDAAPGDRDHVSLTLDGPYSGRLPADGTNLAVRAVHTLAAAAGVPARAHLRVTKAIPVAAGLAGGSADAAGALLACNALWGLGWTVERLAGLAATLGSDVPFSLVGGTAVGTGRGEKLDPLVVPGALHWVLAVADGELSTPAVYRRLDELREAGAAAGPPASGTLALGSLAAGTGPDTVSVDASVLGALAAGDASEVGRLMRNDMQAAAVDLRPSLAQTLSAGREAGALGGIVSGSGPTCVFLAQDAAHSRMIVQALEDSGTCRATEVVVGPVTPSQS
ncbi:4-(cytidine 5'-diphospho)-2-C-methyl-D-erythritol kinase [Phytoactinopolyspora alkaliphila]|uniref:4-diphosphocytidyl-2-C-methyl-D-erythritol kinase n=1 Tax=Phytoactinopolyspora alkaliphila TaxID=1783498 RepID=A0A6N9YJC2_9ACTN|nr:4-(cytidine 5'-diphospho)-2-C-methyl-D-erythritol kinase [Phytoactinopolyspora alkaliphila]